MNRFLSLKLDTIWPPYRPSCVSEENLLQINLWLGAMETTTNLHYDANNNLLFVLKGSKRVALLPPDMTAEVQAMPVRRARITGRTGRQGGRRVGEREARKDALGEVQSMRGRPPCSTVRNTYKVAFVCAKS